MDIITYQLTVLLMEKSAITVAREAISLAYSEDLKDNPEIAKDAPTTMPTDTTNHTSGQAVGQADETADSHAHIDPQVA